MVQEDSTFRRPPPWLVIRTAQGPRKIPGHKCKKWAARSKVNQWTSRIMSVELTAAREVTGQVGFVIPFPNIQVLSALFTLPWVFGRGVSYVFSSLALAVGRKAKWLKNAL